MSSEEHEECLLNVQNKVMSAVKAEYPSPKHSNMVNSEEVSGTHDW
jgi:hypothetical protein